MQNSCVTLQDYADCNISRQKCTEFAKAQIGYFSIYQKHILQVYYLRFKSKTTTILSPAKNILTQFQIIITF